MAKTYFSLPIRGLDSGHIAVDFEEEIQPMSSQLFNLEGKVAVVIGGTSGIGLALARGLAEAGAVVIPTSRRQQQVSDTAHAIELLGRQSLAVASDVADRASLESLASQ